MRLGALLGLALLGACASRVEVDETPAPELNRTVSGDRCETCHPRQYREWAGSSHNYGGGLDPSYQALELLANYLQSHKQGRPGG